MKMVLIPMILWGTFAFAHYGNSEIGSSAISGRSNGECYCTQVSNTVSAVLAYREYLPNSPQVFENGRAVLTPQNFTRPVELGRFTANKALFRTSDQALLEASFRLCFKAMEKEPRCPSQNAPIHSGMMGSP